MLARSDHATALAVAWAVVVIGASMAQAQDLGFGLGDPYRHYADPGNGGGSAYAPFFDPYRGNRIVRGAYPDAAYDGYGYHYGKSAPPSLRVDPRSYDAQSYLSNDPYDHGDRIRLREGETMTTRVEIGDRTPRSSGAIVVERGGRAFPIRHRHRSARLRPARERSDRP